MMRNAGTALIWGPKRNQALVLFRMGRSGGLEDFNESAIQSVSERAERDGGDNLLCKGNLCRYVGRT